MFAPQTGGEGDTISGVCNLDRKTDENSPGKCCRDGGFRKAEASKDFVGITVRSEIARCRGKIKKATEDLNEEKIKLESKVWMHRPC